MKKLNTSQLAALALIIWGIVGCFLYFLPNGIYSIYEQETGYLVNTVKDKNNNYHGEYKFTHSGLTDTRYSWEAFSSQNQVPKEAKINIDKDGNAGVVVSPTKTLFGLPFLIVIGIVLFIEDKLRTKKKQELSDQE